MQIHICSKKKKKPKQKKQSTFTTEKETFKDMKV